MQSHFPFGENWINRAPEETVDGTSIFETRRPSSVFLFLSLNSLTSSTVATASNVPSRLKEAEVIFDSPFNRIFATSFRVRDGSSSSSSELALAFGNFPS